MKWFQRIFTWTAVVAASAFVWQSSLSSLDPNDDYGFAMTRTNPDPELIQMMPAKEIEKVLADHLDLFPRSKVPSLSRHLLALARQHRMDPAFILSVIQTESTFRVKVESYAGAIGLMQLMPATASAMARRNGIPYKNSRSLHDPYTNLSLGVAYLAYLRDRYRGDSPYYQMAAYNLGPARLNELRAQKSFRPVGTKDYYLKIKKGMTRMRIYGVQAERREFAGV
jgi:soluble lytic murein transglycosylase